MPVLLNEKLDEIKKDLEDTNRLTNALVKTEKE